MMRKRRNSGIRDVPGKRPLLGKSLLEHISLTVNMHTTVEELLETSFYIWSTPELRMAKRGSE
jgi:hypothetical protein